MTDQVEKTIEAINNYVHHWSSKYMHQTSYFKEEDG